VLSVGDTAIFGSIVTPERPHTAEQSQGRHPVKVALMCSTDLLGRFCLGSLTPACP